MESDLLLFILVGFLAQLADGALGMAYGLISTSVLLTIGLPPAAASASTHAAEVFTTGISGVSHLIHRNVNRRLFLTLAIAGVIGGVLGAYVLTGLPEKVIKPIVSAYLGLMGVIVLAKAFWGFPKQPPTRGVAPLGVAGGFLDAIGGGGWGPLVVSTLLARGSQPRVTIGSVNLAEFFVTLSISIAFFVTLGFEHLWVILGLVLGGAIAAPFAGWLVKKIPARSLMVLVGILIMTLSAVTFFRG